jgi:hypothetical protein
MPLLYLPSKETVEEIFFKGKRKMTSRENLVCTLVLIVISYIFAIFIPDVGDAMALAGCTTNPMVGIILYQGIDRVHHSSHALLEDPQIKTVLEQGEAPLGYGGSGDCGHFIPRPRQLRSR